MTNEEIIENNKLIAEFMGVKLGEHLFSWRIGCTEPLKEEHLNYDSSWNWLMPVWVKIQNWGKREFGIYWEQSICETFVTISTTKANKFKLIWVNSGDIKDVYYVVTEFIKWHNTTK